ncbi:MAG: glycine cleavage system protein H [Desulfovibrio sp.]|nr:glycine cleavage system protein H [Desulfovibrio sp.]
MKTKELLALLACPQCLGRLEAVPGEDAPEGFACAACGCVYPVREGIPVMLVDEALSREAWDAGARKKEARA